MRCTFGDRGVWGGCDCNRCERRRIAGRARRDRKEQRVFERGAAVLGGLMGMAWAIHDKHHYPAEPK